MKIKSFPFSIFPLVRQKLYHPIFVQYLAITLNKTYTSQQRWSSQSSSIIKYIYQIYPLAQTNPITSITSLCLTILPFLFAAPTHYPATCYLPFNTYYSLLFLPIPTAPAYYLTTSYSLFTTCSCSWLLLLTTLLLTTCCVVLCTVWCAVWCDAVWYAMWCDAMWCFLTPSTVICQEQPRTTPTPWYFLPTPPPLPSNPPSAWGPPSQKLTPDGF